MVGVSANVAGRESGRPGNYQGHLWHVAFRLPQHGHEHRVSANICGGQANEPFLLSLRQDSERLRQLCRDFPDAFSAADSKIVSFYETQLSPTAKKVATNGPISRASFSLSLNFSD
jgi:hypothetical protein